MKFLNVIEAIAASGDPAVWVDVEWGGIRKKSRMIKSRPNLNETFHFCLSLSETFLKTATKADITDAILRELRTKPEIIINVWADPANGMKDIKSLGAAKVPLNKIANAQFQDRTFTDPKSRTVINFQSRVLFEKAILKSAYQKQFKNLNVDL